MACPVDGIPKPFQKGNRQGDCDPLFPRPQRCRHTMDCAIHAMMDGGFDGSQHVYLMMGATRDILHAAIVLRSFMRSGVS